MLFAGCDIGSLTAKAVIIDDDNIVASHIIKVKETSVLSARHVMDDTLDKASLKLEDLKLVCATGYGRFEIPFASIDKTEISCHGLGSFHTDNSIRTIIDIGGQDCKAISVDENGMVKNFIMNEKCAAGTGRSLEILSGALGLTLGELGTYSLKAKKKIEITNKCSIFMELEILQHLYRKANLKELSYAINKAVVTRVLQLVKNIELKDNICITGGVSKNAGVVCIIEELLGKKMTRLKTDPQLMGAYGAALFARMECGAVL